MLENFLAKSSIEENFDWEQSTNEEYMSSFEKWALNWRNGRWRIVTEVLSNGSPMLAKAQISSQELFFSLKILLFFLSQIFHKSQRKQPAKDLSITKGME